MQIQMIDLDGQTLRVATWRGGDAWPPLLIFNGIGANLELVEPFVTALGDVSVIIFDVPGVGGSPAPVAPYRFSTLSVLTDKLLTRLGHRPTLVGNGDAAVEAWRAALAAEARYDLVLMDVHMPGSDGIAAARQIRRIEAERGARRTPVIALTANALDEDRDACLAAGMDGFLTKPLDRERLAAVLAAASAKPMAA